MSDKQRVEIEPYWPSLERFLECMVDDDRTKPEARKLASAALAEVKAYLSVNNRKGE
tara:strand:- start:2945 stop:3115 length:171 start_codon:yes stop_codon:yes gene_type:complete